MSQYLMNYSIQSEPDETESIDAVPLYRFQAFKMLRVDFGKSRQRPLGRSGHRIVASDSHLYSLGGYNPECAARNLRFGYSALFEELWGFNMAQKCWKLLLSSQSLPHFPSEMVSHGLVKCNNAVISHGGTSYPFGEESSSACTVYNFRGNAGLEHISTTGQKPPDLYGMAIVLHEHYLYTIGGTNGRRYSCDVHRLNLQTSVWQQLYNSERDTHPNAPTARYRHEMGYDGNYIYVLGGGFYTATLGFDNIPAFNLAKNTWEIFSCLPDLCLIRANRHHHENGYPKPRKCFACAQHTASTGDVEVFILGGISTADNVTIEYLSDIWRLNLRSKQWCCISEYNIPNGLYFHAAAGTPNTSCMYIFGGIKRCLSQEVRCNHLYKFWMDVPKLSEICWEALTHYYPYMHRADPQRLLMEGIPKYLVDRLTFQ